MGTGPHFQTGKHSIYFYYIAQSEQHTRKATHMARMGMDVDAVEAVSKQLKTQAQQIGTLVASIDKIVNGLTGVWDGPDAHTFVTNWWPQHKKELMNAQTQIDGLGQSAHNNAQEQRNVSNH